MIFIAYSRLGRTNVNRGRIAGEDAQFGSTLFLQTPRQRKVITAHGEHVRAGGDVRKLKAALRVGLRGKAAIQQYRHAGSTTL